MVGKKKKNKMLSLVSYDSSSDSENEKSDSSSDSEIEEKKQKVKTQKPAALPSALDVLQGKASKSVLGNPYREAEDAEIAALEKHVKMVDSDDKISIKNGKKICFNFRKGRCRFGSKCTYAHDSDIQGMSSTPVSESATTSSEIPESNTVNQPCKENKKKRPGLGDSLIPSKKVMKMYSSKK